MGCKAERSQEENCLFHGDREASSAEDLDQRKDEGKLTIKIKLKIVDYSVSTSYLKIVAK